MHRCRPVARGGGGRGGPVAHPKDFVPPFSNFVHFSNFVPPFRILFHPSAILFHPLAILFHPLAILGHDVLCSRKVKKSICTCIDVCRILGPPLQLNISNKTVIVCSIYKTNNSWYTQTGKGGTQKKSLQ